MHFNRYDRLKWLLLILAIALFLIRKWNEWIKKQNKPYARRKKSKESDIVFPIAANAKKPVWIERAVLLLHEQTGFSHRKLAAAFNQKYTALTGQSVGKTWVRQLLTRKAHEALHVQKELKHRIPVPLPINKAWAMDTACVTDSDNKQQIVLTIIDQGSRLCLTLCHLKRFNACSFLGCVLKAVGEHGWPMFIKTDNHAVFHTAWVKRVMRWLDIKMRYSRPGCPWENGRVERFIGTFKRCLKGYAIKNETHLKEALAQFQFWYNFGRPHQHLYGCTPAQVWQGIDPYRVAPKSTVLFSIWNGHIKGMVLRH